MSPIAGFSSCKNALPLPTFDICIKTLQDDLSADLADIGQDPDRLQEHTIDQQCRTGPQHRLGDAADWSISEHDHRKVHLCGAQLLGWDLKKARPGGGISGSGGAGPNLILKRYPKELFVVQQQRVGVIRALSANPPVLLMDEPFGAIDQTSREVIQDEFLKCSQEQDDHHVCQPRHRRGGQDA